MNEIISGLKDLISGLLAIVIIVCAGLLLVGIPLCGPKLANHYATWIMNLSLQMISKHLFKNGKGIKK